MAEGTLEITIVNQDAAPPAFDGTLITGWHVPSRAEFQTLMEYYDAAGLYNNNTAGGDLKEAGTALWTTPNTNAANTDGFAGLPGGERTVLGAFGYRNTRCNFWNDEGYPGMGYYSYLLYNDGIFHTSKAPNSYAKPIKEGLSIRPIKDDPSDWTAGDVATDYDGNVYPTVKIGAQVWMAANLATTHYADGTPIPIVTDNATWAGLATAGMCYYNNTP